MFLCRKTVHFRFITKRYYSNAKNDITIKFETPFKLYNLQKGPSTSSATNRDELLTFFKEMVHIRRVEIAAQVAYTQRMIRGFLHLYNGQEAVCTGLDSELSEQDCVITAYRCHGWMLTKRCGGTPKEVLGELLGRTVGCSHGKGGSMHLYKIDRNFYGGNGIVGSQVPLGIGLAFAQKYKDSKHVTVNTMGDGAANQGQVYESFNLAAIHKLPCIFLVENNQYAMGTSVDRSSATPDFYTRGHYIPGIQFDGMDVLQSRETMRYAKKYALENGPILLEAMTYRYQGHSMSDPGTTYRTRDEVDKIRTSRDPITKVHRWLVDNKLATEEELKEIENNIKEKVDATFKEVIEAPWPPPLDLFANTYVEDDSFIRGVELPLSKGTAIKQ